MEARDATKNGCPSEVDPGIWSLVSGSPLLEQMARRIEVFTADHEHVVIAAPHESRSGSLLAGGHDANTGIIARRIAGLLRSRLIVANEVRTFVDPNKDPKALDTMPVKHPGDRARKIADRRLKLYYQSLLFESLPQVVVEMHGFRSSGNHDIEVSCGFMLEEETPQNKALRADLKRFKAVLVEEIGREAFPIPTPTVGVFPLDREVYLRATGTHTFERIRLLRLAGFGTVGLHIELKRELRPGDPQSPIYDALARALTKAIRCILKESGKHPVFPPSGELHGEFQARSRVFRLISKRVFSIARAPRKYVGADVVVLSARDMKDLGLQDGDTVAVCKSGHQAPTAEVTLRQGTGPKGLLLLNKRVRDRIGIGLGDEAALGTMEVAYGPSGGRFVTVGSINHRVSDERLAGEAIQGESRNGAADSGDRHSVLTAWGDEEFLPSGLVEPPPETGLGSLSLPTEVAVKLAVTCGDILSVRRDEEEIDEDKLGPENPGPESDTAASQSPSDPSGLTTSGSED